MEVILWGKSRESMIIMFYINQCLSHLKNQFFSKRVNDLVSFALFFGFGGITYEQ